MSNRRQTVWLLLILVIALSGCTSVPAAAPTVPAAVLPAVAATELPPVAAPSSTSKAPAMTITSTLDGLTTLPHRIQWVVKPVDPNHEVTSVNYYIDDQLAWVEHNAPYFYGSDGNYLVTSFLKPGEHVFTVRVFTVKGQSGESTVKATVIPAADPPKGLANTSWTRISTAGEIATDTTSGQPGVPGQVGLTIDSVGWMFHDPQGGGLLFDVDYPGNGTVVMRASIEEPPYPSYPYGGAWCQEPDPPVTVAYSIGSDGKTLTLRPIEKDPCGDRNGMAGTWKASTK